MIDILLVHQLSLSQIKSFLSMIFNCASDRILIFSIEEFNSLSEGLNDSSFDCLCVCSPVTGDVAQLLQLYRYKVSDLEAMKRTVEIALKVRVPCYVPSDSFDGWILAGDSDAPRRAQQIECDADDCYLFKSN